MASSQDPHDVTDAPEQVLRLAEQDSRVVINLRADHWPKELVEQARNDLAWKLRRMEHGMFMYPGFTQFLTRINRGAGLLICFQDHTGARISTRVNMVDEIFWIGDTESRGKNGTHAAIRFIDERGRNPFMQLWGNFVLAIAEVPAPVRYQEASDPDGTKFVDLFKKLNVPA